MTTYRNHLITQEGTQPFLSIYSESGEFMFNARTESDAKLYIDQTFEPTSEASELQKISGNSESSDTWYAYKDFFIGNPGATRYWSIFDKSATFLFRAKSLETAMRRIDKI